MLAAAVALLMLRSQGRRNFLCVGSVAATYEVVGAISRLTLPSNPVAPSLVRFRSFLGTSGSTVAPSVVAVENFLTSPYSCRFAWPLTRSSPDVSALHAGKGGAGNRHSSGSLCGTYSLVGPLLAIILPLAVVVQMNRRLKG